MRVKNCVFCEIISGKSPANFYHKDEQFVVFENNLHWYKVQLLLVPKNHMSQDKMWSSSGLIEKLCMFANDIGKRECPDGYRIFSNFGDHGMQSQSHAHLQILGGARLGLYVNGRPPSNVSENVQQ